MELEGAKSRPCDRFTPIVLVTALEVVRFKQGNWRHSGVFMSVSMFCPKFPDFFSRRNCISLFFYRTKCVCVCVCVWKCRIFIGFEFQTFVKQHNITKARWHIAIHMIHFVLQEQMFIRLCGWHQANSGSVFWLKINVMTGVLDVFFYIFRRFFGDSKEINYCMEKSMPKER